MMKMIGVVMMFVVAACAVEPADRSAEVGGDVAEEAAPRSRPEPTIESLTGPPPVEDQCRASTCRLGAAGDAFCTTACGDVSVCASDDALCGPRVRGYGCCIML